MKIFGNQKGLSYMEMVLTISLGSIIMMMAAGAMTTQVTTYSMVATRQADIMDARYALNRIAGELLRVKTADITAIAADQIDFVDSGGTPANFSMGIYNGAPALYRGAELLLPETQSFSIIYYDSLGVTTTNIPDIRQFEVAVTTADSGEEGSLVLTTRIVPREYLYANYQ